MSPYRDSPEPTPAPNRTIIGRYMALVDAYMSLVGNYSMPAQMAHMFAALILCVVVCVPMIDAETRLTSQWTNEPRIAMGEFVIFGLGILGALVSFGLLGAIYRWRASRAPVVKRKEEQPSRRYP